MGDAETERLLREAFVSAGLDPEVDPLLERVYAAWLSVLKENRDALAASDPFEGFFASSLPKENTLDPAWSRALFGPLLKAVPPGGESDFSRRFVGEIFSQGRKGNRAMEEAGEASLAGDLAGAIAAYRKTKTPPRLTPANYFVYYRVFRSFVPPGERLSLGLGIDAADCGRATPSSNRRRTAKNHAMSGSLPVGTHSRGAFLQ